MPRRKKQNVFSNFFFQKSPFYEYLSWILLIYYRPRNHLRYFSVSWTSEIFRFSEISSQNLVFSRSGELETLINFGQKFWSEVGYLTKQNSVTRQSGTP